MNATLKQQRTDGHNNGLTLSMNAKKSPAKKRPAARRKASSAKKSPRKWSAKVTRTSDALDLQSRIFKSRDPVKVARSLKRSAEKSKRKKGTPLQSAMSMLNFYINRAGKNLPVEQKKVLNNAKEELRGLFKKPADQKKS